jgi:Zn-dependent metalloprotease
MVVGSPCLGGEVHDDGRIWSHALWDINRNVGNPRADTIILAAQINFPGTTMIDLANRTVNMAQSLYGSGVAAKVRSAFQARGIL